MNIRSLLVKSSAVIVPAVFSVGAFAADTVDPSSQLASQAFDALKTQVTAYNGYAWPLAVAVVGSMIGIKLFKKFANKAS